MNTFHEKTRVDLKPRLSSIPFQLDGASFMVSLPSPSPSPKPKPAASALYFPLTVSIDHWHVIEFNLMKYFSQYVVALRKFLTMWIFIFALLSHRVRGRV